MFELVRYHTLKADESCKRVALVKEMRKYLYVVVLSTSGQSPMRVCKVAKEERRYMTPLMRGTKPYPMRRALKGFRRLAKSHGATKSVKNFLKEASAEC